MVRPGQVVKWPCLIARIKVETTGLKTVPWRKAARSDLVALDRMALVAVDGALEGALVVMEVVVVFGAKGMCQRPLGIRLPLMMIFPFLMMCKWYFENRAAQLSSQSFPIDMRDPVDRPSRT